MPSPKVSLHGTAFDFPKYSPKEPKEESKSWSGSASGSGSVPSSPVTKETPSNVAAGDVKPRATPPQSASGAVYSSMPYFSQYDNMLHHPFYRPGQSVPQFPLPISIGYAPTLVLPSAMNSGVGFAGVHGKHPIQQQMGFFAPSQSVRPANPHEPSRGVDSSQLPAHQSGHDTAVWASGGAPKPSVIVTKNSSSSSTPGAATSVNNNSNSLPPGSISNGTPIRPPSREPIQSSSSSSSSSFIAQPQCFAGVMNIKSGTLCGTLTPVTLGYLSRPSRVKAITATIPVASDGDMTAGNAPLPSPNGNSGQTNQSNSSASRQSSTPSTPSTPGLSNQHSSANDPPGLMPPPELPKFVLAPTPAQLGRAPSQRRQSSSSSTAQPSSPAGSSIHSGGEEEPISPGGPFSAVSSTASSALPCSPTASATTCTTAPSTPSVPPSPGLNAAGHNNHLAAKKAVFKRNKDGGVDK